jgi:predicted PurR-regulated permease PerM
MAAAPTQPESAPVAASPAANWGPVHLLAALVFVAGCWAGRELLVPILLAMFLALVATPVIEHLRRIRIPRWISAFIVVFGGLALALMLASQLVAPAADWIQKAPKEFQQVAPKLKHLVKKVEEANKAAASIVSAAGAGQSGSAKNVALAQDRPTPPNLWSWVWATPRLLALVAAIVLLSYFFAVFGGELLRKAAVQLPRRQRKNLSMEVLYAIESELANYVLTISTINVLLGALVTLSLVWLGFTLGDALLWGAICGVLNFAPYVGPVIGTVLLGLVGVVAFDRPGQMFLPAALYLGMQLLTSEVVTPIILGRRWSISPLIVLLWLLFCGWLWDIAGVLLAVPILVSFKIVAERVESLKGWSKVIE